MYLQDEFDKIDKKFEEFQNFLANPTGAQQQAYDCLTSALGDNGQTFINNAALELDKIRSFYQDRFNDTTGAFDAALTVAEYELLYINLYKVTKNEISAEDALEEIEENTCLWKLGIILKDVVHVCLALLWLLPIVASVMIMPFCVPLMSLNPLFGVALLLTCTASFVLPFFEIADNIGSMISTGPVEKNYQVELSFFSKMNSVYKPDGKNAPDSSEDFDSDTESSYDIFNPA